MARKKEIEQTLLEKYTTISIEFIKTHLKIITIAVIAIVVITIGIITTVIVIENIQNSILIQYAEILKGYEETLLDIDSSKDDRAKYADQLVELTEKASVGYVKENGYYIAAGIYFQSAKYEKAKTYYDKFLEKNSTSELAPLAYFQSAVCSEWLGNTEEAFLIYKQMEADYSESKYMERIIYDSARLYAQKGDIDKAREYYNRVLTEHPSSYYADQAKKRLMLLSIN
jgi:tetratricopeptide (TPR) repeat protein